MGASLGNSNAYNNLGILYDEGKGVPQDYKKAKAYYEQAVKLGNIVAMNNLGSLYEHGQGVKQDLDIARELYRRAASFEKNKK